MKGKLAMVVALAATTLSGCATVVHGTKEKLKLSSSPEGAKATITNGESCTTPCKIKVKRKNDMRVDFALEGHKPTYVLIQSKLSGAAAGNLLLGGIIGGVVDGTNGASNHLSPNPIKVSLPATGSADEPQLLDPKGKVISTVDAANEKVRYDVAKTIGAQAAGVKAPAATEPAPVAAAPAPAPAAPATTAPATN